jgi:hypothetical protein
MTIIDLDAIHSHSFLNTLEATFPQEVTAGPVIRRLRALGARVSVLGEVPLPMGVTVYRRGQRAPVSVLDQIKGPKFQDELSEPGSASITFANDDPDLTAITDDAMVMFELHGWAAFTMLPRELDRSTISPQESAGGLTTVTGPGTLAILEEALVYPSRGIKRWPIEEDRLFSWPSDSYDDSWWREAWVMAKWSDPTVWTIDAKPGSAPAPEDFPDPDAEWIWAPNTTWMLAPGGTCYARVRFLVPEGVQAVKISFALDWTGTLYLDGQEIGTNTWAVNSWKTTTDEIPVTPGDHLLAVKCANDYLTPEDPNTTQNPGGILVSVAISTPGPHTGLPLVRSGPGWKFLAYPPTEPGMTPGEVMLQCVAEAQWRGALAGVTCVFDKHADSGGASWPIVGDISTKVSTDLLTFFRELSGTYIDFAMAPGSLLLYAWSRGQRGEHTGVNLHPPTNPTDPWTGNLGQLKHKRIL